MRILVGYERRSSSTFLFLAFKYSVVLMIVAGPYLLLLLAVLVQGKKGCVAVVIVLVSWIIMTHYDLPRTSYPLN